MSGSCPPAYACFPISKKKKNPHLKWNQRLCHAFPHSADKLIKLLMFLSRCLIRRLSEQAGRRWASSGESATETSSASLTEARWPTIGCRFHPPQHCSQHGRNSRCVVMLPKTLWTWEVNFSLKGNDGNVFHDASSAKPRDAAGSRCFRVCNVADPALKLPIWYILTRSE